MRFGLLTLLLYSVFNTVWGQSPVWQWAKQSTSTAQGFPNEAEAICTDAAGNVYITGSFLTTTVTFGSTTLTGNGLNDIYVVKYNPAGNVVWAKSWGGTGQDEGMGLAADTFGYVYLTGDFAGSTLPFGNTTLHNTDTISGSSDVFVACLNAFNGNEEWIRQASGKQIDIANAIATDNRGSVYVTGYFISDTLKVGNQTLPNNSTGKSDIFIAKYDTAGNMLWAKSAGGALNDAGNGIAVDPSGNAVITGYFWGTTANFGSTVLTGAGTADIVVAKYNPAGNLIWAKNYGEPWYDLGLAVATDAGGNIAVAGNYSGNMYFDAVQLTNLSGTYTAAFILRLDSDANVIWAKSGKGNYNVDGQMIATDGQSNVYVTGGFINNDSVTFGNVTLYKPTGNAVGDPMYIVEYDPSGRLVCSSAITNGGDDRCAIATDKTGNVYICGDFVSNLFILGNDTLTDNAGERIFTAKFTCGNSTSLPENETLFPAFSVYPNPVGNYITVSTNQNPAGSVLFITDIAGRAVFKSEILNEKSTINCNNWNSGVYLVRLATAAGISTVKKLVKE